MKKKVLASLLVAAMAVGMMAGCGKFVQPTKKDFMSMLERSTKKCMV